MECYSLNPNGTFSYPGKDGLVNSLLFISNYLKVRVMFTTYLVSNSFHDDYSTPSLNSFIWSREIINQCEQIFALHRPILYGIIEDSEGKQTNDYIEVISLKNDENREFKLTYSNMENRFFDQPMV